MIWSKYFYVKQISTKFFSKLIFSKNFRVRYSSLSPKVIKIGTMCSRLYSTHSKCSNVNEIDLNQKPIKFSSLEDGYEQLKYEFIGVSGVYKLTNKNDPIRFYIGSSNNLARRIDEYYKLTKGLRNPQSLSEIEISNTPAREWNLDILYITPPQLSLIFEQYSIINLNPTINNYLKVVPRVNPLWGNNLENAISVIGKFLSLYPKGSEGHNRFLVFLKAYQIANNLNYEVEYVDSKYYCSLIFAYDKFLSNKNPIVYSSINRALKGLKISYSTLLDYINNKYIYKSNLILSFEPLLEENFSEYFEKTESDNQMRKHVTVFNQEGEPVFEFNSAREMARFFKIAVKLARAAITKGEYQDFLLIYKKISYRKTIFVFDSNTHELIIKLDSLTKAMKYAKVNFYTLKNLIDNENPYLGKIYSYKEKI